MKQKVLKQVRVMAGFSQKGLAEKVNVHHSLISKIEAESVQMKPELEYQIKSEFLSAGITEEDIDLINEIFIRRRGMSWNK